MYLPKIFFKSFCKSQFPYKSVYLFFTLVIVKDQLRDEWGSWLLPNDFMNAFCEIRVYLELESLQDFLFVLCHDAVPGVAFRFSGFGFRVPGFRSLVFGFRGSGFGFRVSGVGFRVSVFGIRVSGFGVGGLRAAAEYFLDGDRRVLALDVLFHPLEPLPHLPVLPMEFAQSVAQLLSFP